MGRPRKPEAEKKTQGTFRIDRKNIGLDLEPLNEIPPAPKNFDTDERWFYNTVCESLFSANLLRTPDLMTIQSMAGWWSIMKKAQDDIRDNGTVQKADSGWEQIRPSVNAFEKAWNKLKDFSDRYGFNLISKDKISRPVKKDNPFSALKD